MTVKYPESLIMAYYGIKEEQLGLYCIFQKQPSALTHGAQIQSLKSL